MAYQFTVQEHVAADGTVLRQSGNFRVQLEQVSIIGAQKQIHLTINKVNLDTFEMTQELYAIQGVDYENVRNRLTTGKTMLEEVGGLAWEYLIVNHKEEITFGGLAYPDEVLPEWQMVA